MVRLIVRIDLGPAGHIGPGKIMLLERIHELGSISAAGRSMGMSYRQAWDLVDQLNQSFKEPVVSSQAGGRRGGGATLTEFGRTLVAHYKSITTKAARSASSHVDMIAEALREEGSAPKLEAVEPRPSEPGEARAGNKASAARANRSK